MKGCSIKKGMKVKSNKRLSKTDNKQETKQSKPKVYFPKNRLTVYPNERETQHYIKHIPIIDKVLNTMKLYCKIV